MFGRKKDKTSSFSDVFSVVPDHELNETETIYEPEPAIEEYDEAMFTPIEDLFETLIQLLEIETDWTITELTETDDYGYANYDVIHKSKPITVNFRSYDNDNEAVILIAGEDIEHILGTDLASDIADSVYSLIYNHQDELDATRLERNNESATRFLDLIGGSLAQ